MIEHDVIGFDSGYDFVKLTHLNEDGYLKRISFPSLTYRPFNPGEALLEISEDSYTEERMIVQHNEIAYYVGEYALKHDAEGGDHNFSDLKFRDESEIVKFLAGMALISDEKKQVIKNLVLGLNIRNFGRHATEVERIFSNENFKFRIGSETRRVDVDNVICQPQAVAAIYSRILDTSADIANPEIMEERYGVIDVGGRTTDCIVVDGTDIIDGTQLGLNFGVSDVYKAVGDELGVPYTRVEHAYLAGETTVRRRNQQLTITGLINAAARDLAERICRRVVNEWDQQLDRLVYILICGGGASVLEQDVKKILREEELDVKIPEDPHFANADGYLKLGIYKAL